ncbi:MAG: glycoside hydrolase family 3 protein [Ruthenibacterium lactatiformans]
MDLREQIGQRLVTGFPGTELTEDFRRMVREYKISNVILFRENITDCAQLKQLCGEIQALVRRETGHGAFITADQEGGLVTRLPGDAVNVPGAMAIAATGDPENAYRAGLLTGRELRALGVNFDLAPSVDVNSNPENPVIGARSYGDTPQEVSRYANRMIRGLLDGGVLCSAKHFPGHGDTDTDSHLALPCVDKSMEELERTELLPFREAVRAGVPAVMTTHILFPQLEPEHLPATMSRRIMTGLLREQMGFDGLIVSDCMEMRAIKDHFGTVNGVVAAMAAGVDLVFISTTHCSAGRRPARQSRPWPRDG